MKRFMIIFKDGRHKIVEADSMKQVLNSHSTLTSMTYKSITEL